MNSIHTPAKIIEDLVVAIEMTRQAEADLRNALAARTTYQHSSTEAYIAAKEQHERAECELAYNYDELAFALEAGRAFVAAA